MLCPYISTRYSRFDGTLHWPLKTNNDTEQPTWRGCRSLGIRGCLLRKQQSLYLASYQFLCSICILDPSLSLTIVYLLIFAYQITFFLGLLAPPFQWFKPSPLAILHPARLGCSKRIILIKSRRFVVKPLYTVKFSNCKLGFACFLMNSMLISIFCWRYPRDDLWPKARLNNITLFPSCSSHVPRFFFILFLLISQKKHSNPMKSPICPSFSLHFPMKSAVPECPRPFPWRSSRPWSKVWSPAVTAAAPLKPSNGWRPGPRGGERGVGCRWICWIFDGFYLVLMGFNGF